MGKGSKRRPTIITDQQFQNNWDSIFARKKTPKHGATKIHDDKTKRIPRDYKYKNKIEE